MLKHNYDRSFIAHVACTTPGYEGYLDCAKLAIKNGEAARVADDWMIVTSILGPEPHYFWFRCLFDESIGRPYYDIQSWSRRTGRDFNSKKRHLDCSYNGSPGLYAESPEDQRLWKVMTRQDGRFASMTSIVAVGQKIEARIWTRSNCELQAADRQRVGDHWFACAATSGGQALDLCLEITHIGEELLDDH
ncbi:hypothetical protein [Pseudomonas sp. BBP2017]|uniref:hypothetical protein n=1 Tax=Pseudomonas sp. BBP2017 TaxID=2109731 RepID=UPI000D13B514|nr:hypothetical protein [Pseudomonas sp. BBP2017]PSS58037.1 hypothetical protein C6382_05895 [Pseudomonas sp. BBP2017]